MNPLVCTCHGFPKKVYAKCGSKNPPFPVFCCQNQMLPPLGTFFPSCLPLGVSKNKISSCSSFLGRSDTALVSSSSSFCQGCSIVYSGGDRHGGEGNTVGCWLGPGGNPKSSPCLGWGGRGRGGSPSALFRLSVMIATGVVHNNGGGFHKASIH